MKVPNSLISEIRTARSFLIASHINPDGDALGSTLALGDALKALGKKVTMFSRDGVPEIYRFMPGWKGIKTSCSKIPAGQPLLLLLDCNSPDRAAIDALSFCRTAVIDHHKTESSFGDIRWIDKGAAATGLMVYRLIRSLKAPLTRAMAANLYTAIAVDTGVFRYSNTDEQVLLAAADLVKAGACPGSIAEKLHEQWTDGRFDLLNLSLQTFTKKNGIAIMCVTKDMMRKTGTSESDTENFANFPRMIDSVKISALIREAEDGRLKISMRSKGNVDVSRIAAEMGGGGHKNAAGFRIKSDMDTVKKILSDACTRLLQKR